MIDKQKSPVTERDGRATGLAGKLLNASLLAAVFGYAAFVLRCFSGRWFNPLHTSGDSRQQLFPFFEAIDPKIFEGDLIALSMKSYIAPLHWHLGMFITYLTKDPIMTGHWVGAIQLSLIAIFIWLSGLELGGVLGAAASTALFLHSKVLVRTTISGLPRGWCGPVVAAFMYFLLKKNHWGVLAVILAGSLLNPLGAFISGLTYGAWLLVGLARKDSRAEYLPHLKRALLAAPIMIAATAGGLHRPPEIGQMVGLKAASENEAFQRGSGRFQFLPFLEPQKELAAASRFIAGGYDLKDKEVLARTRTIALIFIAGLIALNFFLRGRLFPFEPLLLLGSGIAAYFAARLFAFHLYVPSRYLIWPPGLFIILALPIGVIKLFTLGSGHKRKTFLECLAVVCLAGFVFLNSGSGADGDSGLEAYKQSKFEGPYKWIRASTAKTAVFAGHPNIINGMQLFGERKAYITYETAHPFYDAYWRECVRRIEIALRLFYAKNEDEFLKALGQEKIDYFIFSFKRVPGSSGQLVSPRNFHPFDELTAELANYQGDKYFGEVLFAESQQSKPTFIAYRNDWTVVVDVAALKSQAASRS